METLALTTSHLILVTIVLLAAYAVNAIFISPRFSPQGKYWRSQSWVGLKEQWMAQFRAGLHSLTDTRSMVMEGYKKFSKNNKTFILPQFVGDPIVVLPADKVHSFLSQPDNILDAYTPNQTGIAQKYTIGSDLGATIHDSTGGPHIDVVRRQLTRRLPQLTADVYEELVLAMENEWPATANGWTTVKAYPTCMKIVSRAANRVFAGKELCRNPTFLESSRLYAVAVFKAGALLKMVPQALHPIAGPYLTRDVRKYLNICKDLALPVIRERIKQIQNPVKDESYEPPRDALQWMLEDCVEIAKTDPTQLDEMRLCRRLLVLNMVAIHTTSMVTANTMLDLFSASNTEEYVTGLREEVQRVLSESGGTWSKSAINDMLRVDSTIRESMRISALGDVGLRRKVTSPSGIDLGDDVHLPRGVTVVVPSYPIQIDPAFYGATAGEWDGFRFSRPREAHLAQVREAADVDEKQRLERTLEQKNQSLISYGDDFLSFGHGRHACPGRFFASQEMKLMIAHIVMTYDVRIEGPRPQNRLINGSSIPTDEAEIMIRLRSSKV